MPLPIEFQNSKVPIPMTAPGARIGATISPYITDRTRPEIELTRMAAAAPIGTAIATTARATRMVLANELQMFLSFHRSTNQRSVQPFHGTMVGSLLSLNAAPAMMTRGRIR